MNKILLTGLIILSSTLPVLAQEQAPALDGSFGVKPFAMDDSWIIDAKPAADGGFYVGGAWHGLARLDAAGNKLWSKPYTTAGAYVDMPGNIAVDGADNVYAGIYDYPQGRILKFNPDGDLLGSYAVDDVLFGVAYNKELNRLYAVTGDTILMLDTGLNLISSAAVTAPPVTAWLEGGIGLDKAGNVYVSGWTQSGTTKRLAGYKYNSGLVKLWEYSEPIGSSPFIAGEAIPDGGMYLIREYRANPTSLLNISNDGVKLWEKQIPEDYHYYKGVDNAGNFYGATWDENNDWAVTIGKYSYEDGAVLWSLPELFSGETDDILADAQDRLYTFGSLMDPVGDDELFVARYGGDGVAPGAVSNLAVTVVSSDSVTLSWTAPGDDSNDGTAAAYDLRYTTAGAITADEAFNAATPAAGLPAPQAAGAAETFTIIGLMPGTTYFFAIKTADEAGNISGLSNSPKGITVAVPKDKYGISSSTMTAMPTIANVNAWSTPLTGLVNIFGSTTPAREIGVDFTISTYPAGAAGFFLSKSSEATNPQGRAEVLLKLGDIPAEYGVTATCDSCEPSSNTVTFTCCGKLPNDHFSQSGVPAWSTHTYARHTPAEQHGTIGYLGCGLTSLATLINYYNANIYSGIPRTNPKDLNTYLLGLPDSRGYSVDSDVNFYAIGRYTSDRVSFVDRYDIGEYDRAGLLETADGLIRSGIPVIFRVRDHFLLVIGKCGENFIVADPAGGREELYNPDKLLPQQRAFRGLRIFSSY